MINTNTVPNKIESLLCMNCAKNNFDTIINPCNHVCICSACVENLIKCPLCFKFIEYTDKIYLPSN